MNDRQNSTRDYARAAQKAAALVAQMTVEEKASQLLYNAPAIERLGIREYNWWNEASHGLARSGMATVFPHAIALAATFDPDRVQAVADAVSTEARAKYNSSQAKGDYDIYKGLTFWTPNINIFRDPRWGRGQETFGEDPYLTAVLGVRYIQGLQGDGAFLKSAACAKHFAVHSGPEPLRHSFNAEVSAHDLWETYLPAFEYAVKAGVAGVMGAYNRTNGEPCCASKRLMQEILFSQWQFDGYFTSDCGAIKDIFAGHHYTDSLEAACAKALKMGCHLNCGEAYEHLLDAYEHDLITEDDLTEAAVRLYTIRVLLGEFEAERPYADIPFEKIECPEHRALNLSAAQESLVLLKNDGFLPLDPEKPRRLAVIGPNAMSRIALEGNYNGKSSEYITVSDGLRQVFGAENVRSAIGCDIWRQRKNDCDGFKNMISEAVTYAEHADTVVLCLGLDCTVEGEENGQRNACFDNGDRVSVGLPDAQLALADAVMDACADVVVVLMGGSAIDPGESIRTRAHALIHAWYPGAVGGLAVAGLIAGQFSPSGRLPVTVYRCDEALPAFTDYAMTGRTYRYLTHDPLYPFGFGLSYTSFAYENASLSETADGYDVTVTVRNTGGMRGVEKVQLYASFRDSRTRTPNCQLCALCPVELAPGESRTVTLHAEQYWTEAVLADGRRTEADGGLFFHIGGHQPDARSSALSLSDCLRLTAR